MIILGIETSCDETAICLLYLSGKKYKILSNVVHSQIDIHKEYGGVHPMLAKREHIKNLPIILAKVFKDSGKSMADVDLVAVTSGPGLEPALWTGINFAEEITRDVSPKIPVIGVNHMEGHIVSTMFGSNIHAGNDENETELIDIPLPALALLISGGHTELVAVESIGSYKIIGRTKDDAVGEAFDKVARMLGLPYPGGPEISKLAESARGKSLTKSIDLPRPMIHSKDLDFSFSGLKTAVLYALKKLTDKNILIDEKIRETTSLEFEETIKDVLIAKIKSALETNGAYKSIIVAGGVSLNKYLRENFTKLGEEYDLPIFLPPREVTGDNALMIALAGAVRYAMLDKNQKDEIIKNAKTIKADGNLLLL